MFGFLKKKIQQAVDSVSKKLGREEKEEKEEKGEAPPILVAKPEAAKAAAKPEKPAGVFARVKAAVSEKELTEDFLKDALEELETVLLENNVAAEAAEKIVGDIKDRLKGKRVGRGEVKKIVSETLRNDIYEILNQPAIDLEEKLAAAKKAGRPAVILFLGFNGTGKSLSVARSAAWLKKKGYKPILAAGDTFRAAGIEQLEEYAKAVDVPVIKHKQGADPAAVIFDAVKAAQARGYDVVLADTAGRAHTDRNLIEELRKIVRVNKPDLKLLVCEAVAGSDVVNQARIFGEAAEINGFILTKWDVDEKGGAALSLCYALRKPILFLGTGQAYENFEEFDVEKAMKGIFG